MPDTSLGITYPASTAHTRLWEHLQAIADDVNGLLDVPDPVNAHANGVNTITATTFTDLPTIACSVALTNPHATRSLLCRVDYGAWISTSTVSVRVCPRISGSLTVAAGIGTNAPTGYGQLIRGNSGSTTYQQLAASYTVTLPVSATAATFTLQAHRESASTTIQVNYATLDITPLRYV